MDPRRGEVDVGGLRIAYAAAGTGPPVVLLHGGWCDGRVWRAQLEDLSDEFTVVAWDAPACGGSDDPPEDFSLADYADCLAGFVAELGLGPTHVVGHSFGGGVALQLGARHPTLPRSLVVAGGYAGWAGSLPPAEVDARLAFALRLAEDLPGPVSPTSVPGLLSPGTPADRVEELAAIMSEVRPAGSVVMARAFAEADLRPVLGEIVAPTLLIYGDADERAPLPVAEDIHRLVPSSTLVVGPGFGHEWYFESPSTFDAEVRRFLRAVA
jgi:pimeloyl-ACP methyl ester carboxylesterase